MSMFHLLSLMGGGGGFDPLSIFGGGEQGIIHDLSRSDGVFQELTGGSATTLSGGGGPIGSLKDFSPNGNWAVAVLEDHRPTWNSAGYAVADGLDDKLNAPGYTGSANYTEAYAVRFTKQDATLVDSIPNTQAVVYRGGSLIGQDGNFVIQSGGSVVVIAETTADAVLFISRASGVGSIQIDNGVPVTGAVGANIRSGLQMFQIRGGLGNFIFSGRYYAGVIINRALTAPEKANLITWLGSKQGRVL